MRRPRHLVPALLVAATLLTGSAVAAGVLVDPVEAERTGQTGQTGQPAPAVPLRVVDDAPPTEVSAIAVRARPATGRRAERQAVSRQATGALSKVAPYRLQKAGPPLRKIPPAPPEPVAATPFTFQVGTLNVQGSQHRPNGTGRAAMHASTVLGRGVDLVGFQEVQDDQLAVLNARLPGWTIWPGQSLGNQGVRLQIGWRDDMFELADTGSIITTFDHQRRPIPYVLLRDRATAGEFYVIDLHNSPRDQEADRDSATTAQIALIQQLEATGKPVLVVGDTNEKTEFTCRVAAATGMIGSNGATPGACVGYGPVKIDKIMGTGGMTSFSGHVVDYGAPVRAATDHAFVRATVTITPLVPPAD